MITVEHITKKFVRNKNKKEKEEFYADSDITFEANDGEIIGILGPNGAGKTTLLRMIAGILEPTTGKISFDGMNYKDNGIGIKNGEITRVFERGFTGENGRRIGQKSTGIGLYLCKKLCDKLCLSIELNSKKDEGTEVRIIFPKNSYTNLK